MKRFAGAVAVLFLLSACGSSAHGELVEQSFAAMEAKDCKALYAVTAPKGRVGPLEQCQKALDAGPDITYKVSNVKKVDDANATFTLVTREPGQEPVTAECRVVLEEVDGEWKVLETACE